MDEFEGNLSYTGHDLHPHFALNRAVKDAGGSKVTWFNRDGEKWAAVLYYHTSGLAPRDHPDYRLETVREHRIHVRPLNDPAGKRRAKFYIAPRWPNMKATEGRPPSSPNMGRAYWSQDGEHYSTPKFNGMDLPERPTGLKSLR